MASDADGVFRNDATRWALVTGSRVWIAAGILGVSFVLTIGLLRASSAGPGQRRVVANIFGNGFVPGIITLITVSLSVNQLILSRVFGSPGQFFDRLDETLSFRRRAENRACRTGSPSDPARFLEFVERAIRERTDDLRRYASETGDEELSRFLDEMEDYCDHLRNQSAQGDVMDIVVRTFGTRYAAELRRTRRQLDERRDELPSEATDDLETIFDLLEEVAVLRQFFRTIAIQQDLAMLSRRVGVLGVASLFVSVFMAANLEHTLAAVTGWPLPLVVSVAFVVAVSPVVMLVSYVMRLATISLHTLSVGPFVPPNRTGSD